jgi:hypothetical protein
MEMWFTSEQFRDISSVNPYISQAHYKPVIQQTPFSSIRVMQDMVFVMFMFPAFLACVYTFSSVRMVDSGQLSVDVNYGDHEIKVCNC